MSEEKQSKSSKEKKRKRSKETEQQDASPSVVKNEKKEKKRRRREEKKQIMQKLPKTDDDGIAFTKLQLRRMMKRVKRGLPPIPTKKEQRELKRQEAITRREEEAELAGMMTDTLDEQVHVEVNEILDKDDDDDVGEQEFNEDHLNNDTVDESPVADAPDNARKRKKRSKPVPEDYVCQACQNKHQPSHWIYDCPNKVTVRGTNHVSKKLRGIHAPDDRKVFVSGLSFDTKKRDVELIFKDCGTIVRCKLLTFPDTGRCKGQAYLTFDSDASAKKARMLNGTSISKNHNDDEGGEEKRTKGERKRDSSSKRMELKLKVTKVLNRTVTKNFNRSS